MEVTMQGNHNIQIEINGEACQSIAYQAGDGILIHLPGVQAPHAPAFETLFQPLPEDRLNSGFVEAGEWDGQRFPFDGEVQFVLGPDGAVWAKVCDSLNDLPTVQIDGYARAWRILAEAEEAFGAKSTVRERAACGGWRAPLTIPDFLFWMEDEAAVQEQQAAGHPEEGERRPYACALRGIANELRALGFLPAPAPWIEKDGGQS